MLALARPPTAAVPTLLSPLAQRRRQAMRACHDRAATGARCRWAHAGGGLKGARRAAAAAAPGLVQAAVRRRRSRAGASLAAMVVVARAAAMRRAAAAPSLVQAQASDGTAARTCALLDLCLLVLVLACNCMFLGV